MPSFNALQGFFIRIWLTARLIMTAQRFDWLSKVHMLVSDEKVFALYSLFHFAQRTLGEGDLLVFYVASSF